MDSLNTLPPEIEALISSSLSKRHVLLNKLQKKEKAVKKLLEHSKNDTCPPSLKVNAELTTSEALRTTNGTFSHGTTSISFMDVAATATQRFKETILLCEKALLKEVLLIQRAELCLLQQQKANFHREFQEEMVILIQDMHHAEFPNHPLLETMTKAENVNWTCGNRNEFYCPWLISKAYNELQNRAAKRDESELVKQAFKEKKQLERIRKLDRATAMEESLPLEDKISLLVSRQINSKLNSFAKKFSGGPRAKSKAKAPKRKHQSTNKEDGRRVQNKPKPRGKPSESRKRKEGNSRNKKTNNGKTTQKRVRNQRKH